ncbi:NADH dehydrogenase [Saccharopolyspora erythraea NRRL 2338]|uniref:NAD(P)/FAD-dependent oxidoreductase n=1 Tax=Saccharopolyspora erythraea TaxID=1836 RepID=UPI0003209484|nr:FAD-dependent oxidoreductase [Saccharopolyspora erythraea]PFG95986.1 NADH dehydrogenase [Saccharopolyspora erythraea NRRL 2338]QRK92548.1 FAD-dependent oxidoreductase [Saccharopolyspora erythraea]
MSNILVVGGGFAGVWSAAAAVRLRRVVGAGESELSVTLVSAGDDLVIRPRLYQAEPERMRVSLDRVLGPVGVDRVAATATGIDTGRRRVTAVRRDGRSTELAYDRLVLATGSHLVRPDLPGAEHLHDVDTLPAAAALDAHLHRLPDLPDGPGRFTAVVVGAGFTGLEIATELVDRLRAVAEPHGAAGEVRVVLVERADVVGPDLGPGPRPVVLDALSALGVEQRLGATVRGVERDRVRLSDGSVLDARTVVWTAGVRASPLTADVPAPRDGLGRLEVDPYLRVAGVPEVYAAGDTAAAQAEDGHQVMQSCQHAGPLGRFAGHNVAADLLGLPQEPFAPDPYVTCLDLGSAGAVFTTGWRRTVTSAHHAAKQRKRTVNEVWIHPPADDAEELLRRADFRVSTRQPVAGG